jgi:patatin-like phospholipase/acyl hydrolase
MADSTYRILSLDGGAARGIYTAALLRKLDERVPGFAGRADLIAGSSSGGILALGLAVGMTPPQVFELWRDNVRRIFHRDWLHLLLTLGGLVGARYDNRTLRELATKALGDKTLGDLGQKVLLPTFDLDNEGAKGQTRRWKPKFFHNFEGKDSDGAVLAKDVAVRTSAGPAFFPTHQGYIDGSVVANNPSLAALALALHEDGGRQKIDRVRLFSLGAGSNPKRIEGDRQWGFIRWARPFLSIVLEGMTGVAHYQCEQLLGTRNYRRLDPDLPEEVAFDGVEKADKLIALADKADITEAATWLEANFGP